MKKNLLILGVVLVLGACSSPSKENTEGEETAEDTTMVEEMEEEMDSLSMEIDSAMTEMDTLMAD